MIQKIFFFFMIGISVCVAKPSEVVPASRGQDPLENRKQWQQEYRQILAQEKNQIKPPSQARNPRYMKRLYMDLKRMNDRIEAKQKKRLEEIARQNPKNPELVRQEKERMEKNRVFSFDADLGEQTDKNISIQEKEAALNNKIVKDPRAFYQEISSNMLFSEGFNQQKIQETTSFFKKSYIYLPICYFRKDSINKKFRRQPLFLKNLIFLPSREMKRGMLFLFPVKMVPKKMEALFFLLRNSRR